jgi:flagellar M-ring protein FliF
MADWRQYQKLGQDWLARVPVLAWVVAGLIAVSLAVVFSLEMSGPSYSALYEGLAPADGGKVIAALQKLGIPYQLQGAGSIILVPAPDLAEARLQLGAENIPQAGGSEGWDKLENAPMTASQLAQDTMAAQALESSLEQTIDTMTGITSAQVFLALPPDTPFLADQPKPSGSVIIAADPSVAQSQGPAIASLIAGAVPGMTAQQVTVETTAGVTVFPAPDKGGTQAQMATVAQVENEAAARVALLLAPLVGQGNFRTDVSADVDFTQEQIHQITYGPSQLVSHETSSLVEHTGNDNGAGFGLPGALSNEPPPATTAASPGSPDATQAAAAQKPHETSKNTDQTYVTDQSENDITKPDWAVRSIAVSVVLNKAALGMVTTDQVKAAVAAGFAYPNVSVNVLAASFQKPPSISLVSNQALDSYAAITRAALQMMAAAALLFGLALPLSRRMSNMRLVPEMPMPAAVAAPRPKAPALPPPADFAQLRERATENITTVARLLQSWVEDDG